MNLEIREEPIGSLGEHAKISIAFLVDKILVASVLDGGLGGIVLHESAVDTPYIKDYDAIKGEGPTRWSKRFDVTHWGLIAAYQYGTRVGGAVVAFKTPHLEMLGEESVRAALWDIRIRPDLRKSGIGSLLFHAVQEWASMRGCTQIHVETQNVNVPACHFYAKMGCALASINCYAYPELPEEVQFLWRVDL
ncbi:MAG: GNAT family N-acetyltransferase [Acidimicrobiales bacterium]